MSDLILLCLFCQEVKGKRRLQDILYLLCLKLSVFQNTFLPGYFGPYSSRISYEVDILSTIKLLSEEVSPKGDGSFLSIYSLTPDGRVYCDKLIKEYPAEYEVIRNVMEQIREIQDEELNKITKTCFILRVLLREFEERAGSHGWQLSKQGVREALAVLEKIGVKCFLDLL